MKNSKTFKIVQINTVCNNSTGRIMHDIQKYVDEQGMETLSLVGRRKIYTDVPCIKIGNNLSFWIHVFITTLFDLHGLGSRYYTNQMVEQIKKANPDIIHLHNIHGYYLNYPILFDYLNNDYNGKIVWTFHDCWPMTGHCPHFVIADCDRWEKQCYKCPNKMNYPISLGVDNCRSNYLRKKNLFTKREDIVITTPSEWMLGKIRKSFFVKDKMQVIHNGIDMNVFDYSKATGDIRDVVSKYCIDTRKRVILGVASVWEKRKGLDDMVEIAKQLSEDYVMILVGLSSTQIQKLPGNVIGIAHTQNVCELVALYSMADIFINPSQEESFSLVTIEAQACGTPCIVLDTSAVKDLVSDDNGVILHSHLVDDYLNAIEMIIKRRYSREQVRESAIKYSNENMIKGYFDLYMELCSM